MTAERPFLIQRLYAENLIHLSKLDSSRFSGTQAIDRYWNGECAQITQSFSCSLAWSPDSVIALFEANGSDELVVSDSPNLNEKTIGLWERDVCEIFIAPDKHEPRRYFEFEIAPTGEWLDLAIDSTSGERVTDWEYHSGMEAAAMIEDDRVIMAMKIPWKAFGRKPKNGDVWLGNIFRCIGREPHRGYLAWQPTQAEEPAFHVPDAFGEFIFLDR